MGLDMYLAKRTYVGNKYRKPNEQVKVEPAGNTGAHIVQKRVSEIIEDVAYWRKANQIHHWFVENVQDGNDDCGDYDVSRDQLVELRDLCKRVIEHSKLVKGKIEVGYSFKDGKRIPTIEDGEYIEDPSYAKENLPVQEGFFFGSYGYDQYYLQDLQDTVKQLDEVLSEPDTGDTFSYHSSW